MDLDTYGVDVSISKRIRRFAPYLGMGAVLAQGSETTSKVNLHNEDILVPRGMIGAQYSIYKINIAAEAELAEVSTFSIRTGFRF